MKDFIFQKIILFIFDQKDSKDFIQLYNHLL